MVHDLTLAAYWYLILTGFGIVVLPLSMVIFRFMPEGGILLSRTLGWLLIGFSAWFLTYLKIPLYNFAGLVGVGALFAGLSLVIIKLQTGWLWRRWRQCWRTALNGEVLTILVYLLILFARREDPSLNNTEKWMDIMFLNGLTYAQEVPPPDPWFAGSHINYHYGGYFLNAIPVKLTGIPPEIAYNLAIGALAAMSASCAFALGRALFGRCRWGALSVVATLLLGNMAGVFEIFRYDGLLKDIYSWRFGYMWATSRVIYDVTPGGSTEATINEYPLFTQLWGDLHPHYNNMPFLLFFLALVYSVYRALTHLPQRSVFYAYLPLFLVTAISAAMIFPTNLFDFPIGALLLGGLVMAAVIQMLAFRARKNISWTTIALRGQVILLPLVAYLLAAPFWLNFESPLGKGTEPTLKINTFYTDFPEFLHVFALHFAATLVYLCLRGSSLSATIGKEGLSFILIILAFIFVALWGWSGYLVFSLTPVIALALWAIFFYQATLDSKKDDALLRNNFALALCALSWSTIAGCEFIFINDNYSSERLNTLFKFHFPCWLMLGIGLPYLVVDQIKRTKDEQARVFGAAPVLALFLLSLLPPVYIFTSLFTMPAQNRPVGLDGIAFLERERPDYYSVIEWVRENTSPNDRILELPGFAYTMDSSLSAYTGRHTLMGWDNHEGLWRGHVGEVSTRTQEVLAFYTSTDWEAMKAYIRQHEIKYVFLKRPDCNQSDAFCRDRVQMYEQMRSGMFREKLDPVIITPGSQPYELFKVPDVLE